VAGAGIAALGLLVLGGLLQASRSAVPSGRLERNSAVGIRTRATLSSDAAWLAGHRAAAGLPLAAALTGHAAGVLTLGTALLAGEGGAALATVLAAAGYLGVVGLVVAAAVAADREARRI